jgi:RecB family exonuclease
VRFAGRVDRVDETPRGARVIDYKTGSGVSETNRLKARLSVQLPVYALAVRAAAAAEGVPCEHVDCRYQMVTRRGGFAPVPLELGDEEREAGLARLAGTAMGLIEAGVFPRAARGRCDYCDVKYACGTSAWARGRKRRDGALATLVALQGGELDGTGAEQGTAAAGDARKGEANG